jgi:hypothetical protein
MYVRSWYTLLMIHLDLSHYIVLFSHTDVPNAAVQLIAGDRSRLQSLYNLPHTLPQMRQIILNLPPCSLPTRCLGERDHS